MIFGNFRVELLGLDFLIDWDWESCRMPDCHFCACIGYDFSIFGVTSFDRLSCQCVCDGIDFDVFGMMIFSVDLSW